MINLNTTYKSCNFLTPIEAITHIYGKECAVAYEILMSPDQQKINEIQPQLENILRLILIESKDISHFEDDKLSRLILTFIQKLEQNIISYFKNLRNFLITATKISLEKNEASLLENQSDLKYMINLESHRLLTKKEFDPFFGERILELKNELQFFENANLSLKTDLETREIFQLFYQKLPDSTPINIRWTVLDGNSLKKAATSIFEDLNLFLDQEKSFLKCDEIQCIEQQIIDLQFLLNTMPKMSLGEYAARIILKLKVFSAKTKLPYGSIIMRGGFHNNTVNHTFLYQIKRNDFETFDFSLINTGSGAIILLSAENKISYKSKDVVYTGLTLGELSKQFFMELNQKIFAKNIEEIYEFLDNSLLNHSAKKVFGLERMLQQRGNCTIKPFLELFKTDLGRNLFRKFYVFMLKQTLTSVQERAKTITLTALKLLFPVPSYEVPTPKYYSDQLGLLIDAGRSALEDKRVKYGH